MARSFLTSLNLNKNEIQNARIQNLASAPGTPVTGQIYYNTTDNKSYYYNGTAWVDMTGGAGAPGAGTLALTASAGATNTAITIGTGTGFNANTSSNFTYDIDVGPAISALATTMTGAGTGFLRKNGADTYSLDTATYITGNQSITLSGDASGTGATAITVTLANSGVTAGTYNNSATQVRPFTVDAKGRVTGIGTAVTIAPLFSSIASKPTTISGYGITDTTAQALTGYVVGTNTALAATDTILAAFQKCQGQINARLSAETDTLATVTGRGATTATAVSFTNATNNTLGTVASGALQVTAGGAGISGNLTVGGDIQVKGSDVVLEGATVSLQGQAATLTTANILTGLSNVSAKNINIGTSSTGGAVNINLGGNAIISGDLTVNGTTTTIHSTVTTIDDPVLTLGGDTAPTSDDNKDRGIEFRWHNGTSAKIGFFGYDDSTGFLTYIPDATVSSEVFSGTIGGFAGSAEAVGNTHNTVKTKVWTGTQAEYDGLTKDANTLYNITNAPAPIAKYSQAIAGTATSEVITHNLNTRDCTVQLVRATTPWDTVEADVEMTSVNTITLRFASAPTAGEYRVVVIG
ncbi:MAG TPA: hypothetical protein VLA40_08290 [Rheinheimera sp.]|nr:hypothetical protein [Rheinheimera sp.]